MGTLNGLIFANFQQFNQKHICSGGRSWMQGMAWLAPKGVEIYADLSQSYRMLDGMNNLQEIAWFVK